MQGRYQFSWQAAEGQKRFCLESFSFFFFFFVRCTSITFTVHIKRMSYPRQCASSLGVIWWSQGLLRNESNNAFPFAYPCVSGNGRCLDFCGIWVVPLFFMLAKSLCLKKGKKKKHLWRGNLHPRKVVYHLRGPLMARVTWRQTLCYQVVPWDQSRGPRLNYRSTAKGPTHTEKPFPAHMGVVDK